MARPLAPNILLRRLAEELQPRGSEVAAAYAHTASLRVRLGKSFHVAAIKRIGSHSRGTAIRTYSDVDILAVLRRKEVKWGKGNVSPESFARRIAADLRDRYTATEVRRDAQAVVLRFQGGAEAVDLVPGIFERFDGISPVYRIPGNRGDWIETSPDRHDRLFRLANVRSGGKLRIVSQLIKGWRFGRTPPYGLSSFYTDMLLASTGIGAGVQSYGECLAEFFSELARRNGRGVRDPAGIAGVIPATHSEPALERLVNAAALARERCGAALKAADCEEWAEANRQWCLLFNLDI
jgi:hypothetical protein